MIDWNRLNRELNQIADQVASAAMAGEWDRARILGTERDSTMEERRLILAAVTESIEKSRKHHDSRLTIWGTSGTFKARE